MVVQAGCKQARLARATRPLMKRIFGEPKQMEGCAVTHRQESPADEAPGHLPTLTDSASLQQSFI